MNTSWWNKGKGKGQRALKRTAGMGLLALIGMQQALAGLPEIEDPTSGKGNGGLMDTAKGHFQDGIVLVALIIAAVAFIVVANGVISSFNEVREGKNTWGKFGAMAVVGVVLIVIVIWLVNKASNILF